MYIWRFSVVVVRKTNFYVYIFDTGFYVIIIIDNIWIDFLFFLLQVFILNILFLF